MASTTTVPAPGRKALEDYTKLKRSPMQSMVRTAQMAARTAEDRPPLQDYDSNDILPWIESWIKATFTSQKHPFPTYAATGEQGHYDLSPLLAADGSIRIALAGDWGTGTDVAQQVACNMIDTDPPPELTIHLGDVYYVGWENEVLENCLGQDSAANLGVQWPHGTKGSFALNGNHEMYSGGNGYFDRLIPSLGIPATQDQKQLASFFCLETPVWRILAIDTGYNADTLFGDCHLEPAFLTWLQTVVDPVNNRKPTILLSHHQWFSGFGDGDYPTPGEQMSQYLRNQEIVWLWGHEHRLALYYPYKSPNHGLSVYARCMGHGGMPCEIPDTVNYPDGSLAQKVEYWDGDKSRFQTLQDGTVVSKNGYVQMTINGPTLTLEYLDSDKTSVLKESFAPNGGDTWDGTLSRTIVNDPHILTQITWEE
jgi:hypothetical protein